MPDVGKGVMTSTWEEENGLFPRGATLISPGNSVRRGAKHLSKCKPHFYTNNDALVFVSDKDRSPLRICQMNRRSRPKDFYNYGKACMDSIGLLFLLLRWLAVQLSVLVKRLLMCPAILPLSGSLASRSCQ